MATEMEHNTVTHIHNPILFILMGIGYFFGFIGDAASYVVGMIKGLSPDERALITWLFQLLSMALGMAASIVIIRKNLKK